MFTTDFLTQPDSGESDGFHQPFWSKGFQDVFEHPSFPVNRLLGAVREFPLKIQVGDAGERVCRSLTTPVLRRLPASPF